MIRSKSHRTHQVSREKSKSKSIQAAYRKFKLKVQAKPDSRKPNGVNYLERYLDSAKIYSKTNVCSKDRQKQKTEQVLLVKNARTASFANRQQTYQLDMEKQFNYPDINLYVSESRRKMIHQKVTEGSQRVSQANRYARAQSAKQFSQLTQNEKTHFPRTETRRSTKVVEFDPKASIAISRKLNGATRYKDDQIQRESVQKRKINRQKIMIFEQGVLLRKKY